MQKIVKGILIIQLFVQETASQLQNIFLDGWETSMEIQNSV